MTSPVGATEALRARLGHESAMQAKRGDVHLSALLDEAVLALAQQPSAPSAEPAADLREKLIDAIAAGLGGTYHCTRAWSAWHVGTMSQDDFEPVDESDTPTELADAVLSIIGAAPLMANGLTERDGTPFCDAQRLN